MLPAKFAVKDWEECQEKSYLLVDYYSYLKYSTYKINVSLPAYTSNKYGTKFLFLIVTLMICETPSKLVNNLKRNLRRNGTKNNIIVLGKVWLFIPM